MNNTKLSAALQSVAMILGAAGIVTAHPDGAQITSLIQPTVAAVATLWGLIANHQTAVNNMARNNIPLSKPNAFLAQWQGQPVTGWSGVIPFVNRTCVYQPCVDLGPYIGRRVFTNNLPPF